MTQAYATWRSTVSQRLDWDSPGLLVSAEDALPQYQAGALKPRARVPFSECGVSLAACQRLCDSVKALELDGRARTTQMVVARLLSPAGLLHVPPPLPRPMMTHAHPHPSRSSLDSTTPCSPRASHDMQHAQHQRGPHPAASPTHGDSAPTSRGPSNSNLRMRESMEAALASPSPSRAPSVLKTSSDTRGVPPSVARALSKTVSGVGGSGGGGGAAGAASVRARERDVRVRLWNLVDPHWCGKPSYFVSHCWTADFVEMMETLIDRLARQPDHRSNLPEEEEETGPDLTKIFVWLDFIALPQQYLGHGATLDGPIFGPPAGTIDVWGVKEVVNACEKGLVIVLDKQMAILNRVWPLYEVWCAAYYCPQDLSSSRVYAAIPKGVTVDALLHLQVSCLTGLDLGRNVSARAEDKQHIMTEVRQTAGQKRMQILACESILRAARGWLRWSGDPQDMSLYAALMIQSKEYAQLQYVLNTIDEIHDDEATLKEIRDLFAIYDEDGTGSLEEDEFAQVLGMAGFGQEESRSIFKQVDTDGGGSVELDEFEAWWIESQRQHNRTARPKPEMTVKGLVNNLHGLGSMLYRRNNTEAGNNVTKLCEELEAAAAGPKSPFPEGQLPAAEIYGDWRTVANTLGFRVHFNDLRPALRMMHGLLLSNVDTLALDTSPAALLPSPHMLGNDAKLHKVTLAWFMALMAELLCRNPRTLREADFFFREAVDLSAPEKHDVAVHSSRNVIDAAINKGKRESVKSVRNDAQMESIVTDMVRLKHGKDTIVSNRLVAEANVSLSTWMASSKGKTSHTATKKGQKSSSSNAAQVQSVIDFTTNYLANNSGGFAVESSGGNGMQGGSSSNNVQGSSKKNKQYEGKSHGQLAYQLGVACLKTLNIFKRGLTLEEELEENMQGEGEAKAEPEIAKAASLDTDEESGANAQDTFDRFQLPSPTKSNKSSKHRPRTSADIQRAQSESDSGPVIHQPHPPATPSEAASNSPKVASQFRHRDADAASESTSGQLALESDHSGYLDPPKSTRLMPRPPDAPSQTSQPQPQHPTHTPAPPHPLPPNHILQAQQSSLLNPTLPTQPQHQLQQQQLSLPCALAPVQLQHNLPPATARGAHTGPLTGAQRTRNATLSHSPQRVDGGPEAEPSGGSVAEEQSLFNLPKVSVQPRANQHVHDALHQQNKAHEQPGKMGVQDRLKDPFVRSSTTSLATPRYQSPDDSPSSTAVRMPDLSSNPTPFAAHMSRAHPSAPSLTNAKPSHELPSLQVERSGGTSTVSMPAIQSHQQPPSVATSLIGNSFAQRVAAAKEQPRITTPMTQPLVGAQDLEALRQRKAMPSTSRVTTAEGGHRPTPPDAKFNSGGPHTQRSSHSFTSTFNSSTPGSQPSLEPSRSKSLSRGSADTLQAEPSSGKSTSRLKKASSTLQHGGSSTGAGVGLSQMSQRSSLTSSTTKWLSQLTGTSLPSFARSSPINARKSGPAPQ